MSAPVRRATGLLVAGLLASSALTGCGAGGFGSDVPPAPDLDVRSYVALGDGFVAAPYAGDTPDSDGCRRSTENYPALVAEELDIDDVQDVSCTGATTAAITQSTEPGDDAEAVPPQIDAVSADTDLVSIGMGIEDRDLLRNAFEVCTGLPCPSQITAQKVLADVGLVAESLVTAVRAVQDKAVNAYIVLVGYPRILPAEGSCAALPELDQARLDAANYLFDYLNRQLQSTARQTGADFIDVAKLSADHELCSEDPWVQGKRSRPGKSVAYHPLAAEQRAVAEALAEQVRTR